MSLPPSQSYLFHSIGRLSGITDSILSLALREPLNNLHFLSVSFRSFFLTDEVLSSAPTPLSLLVPNLVEVEIEMTNDPPWEGRPHNLSAFMRALCSQEHPSVRRLVLTEVSRANDTTLIRARDVVQGFPRLTELRISNWDGGNDEFSTLWRGLPHLEEVHLRFCHHLGDEGVADMVNLKGTES